MAPNKKYKRLSASMRIHVRRLKQAAHDEGVAYKSQIIRRALSQTIVETQPAVAVIPAQPALVKKAQAAKAAVTKDEAAKAPAKRARVAPVATGKTPAAKALMAKVSARKVPVAKAFAAKEPGKKAPAVKALTDKAPARKVTVAKVLTPKTPVAKTPAASKKKNQPVPASK